MARIKRNHGGIMLIAGFICTLVLLGIKVLYKLWMGQVPDITKCENAMSEGPIDISFIGLSLCISNIITSGSPVLGFVFFITSIFLAAICVLLHRLSYHQLTRKKDYLMATLVMLSNYALSLILLGVSILLISGVIE